MPLQVPLLQLELWLWSVDTEVPLVSIKQKLQAGLCSEKVAEERTG